MNTRAPRAREALAICALLAILVFAVFGQTVRHDFVNYDDHEYVYENAMVSKGLSLEGAGWAFTHVHAANWHPLTTLSHMLDCQLYGLRPGGHHLENVVLHAACAVLLFLMLREMTGAQWRSAFVAALFAIHPLRVESVAWVSERKDVLSGVFFMLTLWAYARYARGPGSWKRYAMVALWLVLGLLSKPMLVTTPFVLLLLDYWPLERLKEASQLPRLLKEKIPLMALAALSCVATVIAQKEAIQPIERLPLSLRASNAVVACVVYIGKLIYPSQLAVLYPLTKSGPEVWKVICAFLLLCALTGGAYLLRRSQPYLLTGWLWYLGMLVPVIGLLQVGAQAYADRYTYLPEIGLCIGGTWAAEEWAGGLRLRRVALGCVGAAVLCVLTLAAWHQTTYWRDSITLWTHTLECTRDNAIAQATLGYALAGQGRNQEAISYYQAALRINPAYAEVHNNLGNALAELGRTDEAIAHFRVALKINPATAIAHDNLGNALLQEGQTEEAISEYQECLRLDPTLAVAHDNLGDALLKQGQPEPAVSQYREALRINPALAEAHDKLGNALLQQGQMKEAVSEFQECLRIKPALAEAHINLGNALLQQGQTEEAVSQYREVLRLKPANVEAHNNLGNALLQQGQTEEAIVQIQEALKLEPANGYIENNLAWTLATASQTSLRNGPRAVQLATQACEATGGNNPGFLRTLAAAHAEAGEFPDAVQTAQRALELAEGRADAQLADALRQELQLYEAGHRLGEAH